MALKPKSQDNVEVQTFDFNSRSLMKVLMSKTDTLACIKTFIVGFFGCWTVVESHGHKRDSALFHLAGGR